MLPGGSFQIWQLHIYAFLLNAGHEYRKVQTVLDSSEYNNGSGTQAKVRRRSVFEDAACLCSLLALGILLDLSIMYGRAGQARRQEGSSHLRMNCWPVWAWPGSGTTTQTLAPPGFTKLGSGIEALHSQSSDPRLDARVHLSGLNKSTRTSVSVGSPQGTAPFVVSISRSKGR